MLKNYPFSYIFLGIIFVLQANFLQAQDSLAIALTNKTLELNIDSLNRLGEKIITDTILDNRNLANTQYKELLNNIISEENAFLYNFDSLKTASVLTSPDSSFKIFTWQVFINDTDYLYEGIIQHRDKTLIDLDDKSEEYMSLEFERGDAEFWYGCLYYRIVPFKHKRQDMYLLFGFDAHSLMERRKVIEVMTFENNQPKFGHAVFFKSEDSSMHPATKNRVALDYFAGASIKCNYEDAQEKILFDHMIFTSTPYGDYLIPDGSYEAYTLSKGKWVHEPKVFHDILEEAPRPKPVFSDKKEEKKDIFGN